MKDPLPRSAAPELIFGLLAPVGVDLDLITEVLQSTLREMHYKTKEFRLTNLMREIPVDLSIRPSPYIASIKDRIAYANEVRRLLGNEALASLAISAIRDFRAEQREKNIESESSEESLRTVDQRAEEIPLPSQAYIIRQFKRPEEISLLRSVYGKQFILVSGHAPEETRRRRIEEVERHSKGGVGSEVDIHNDAYALVAQDAKEISEKHGQNVRDAFPLGDVFIDATTRIKCEDMVRRFVHLLFGSNEITPTHDEYGMYIAKSAGLRSSDLSRQVGSAIFRPSGEIATLGCNEVPKTGGGTYWTEDTSDRRDFVEGHDPNDRRKAEVLVDLLGRLQSKKYLSAELQEIEDPQQIGKKLLSDESEDSVKESKLMDIIEFGRIIHAEMSAISDAARLGVPIKDGTLFCTVFPCHICAKHIVASGIRRVVYLEPYAKSYAEDLHKDSIHVDPDSPTQKVSFEAFIGVSP
jgi:cytidine deaminase